ncbi:MAG: ATP-binding protein [Spirochaetia bacterium]|nr:ATP-binding protein [Spirochaetia bacterium]
MLVKREISQTISRLAKKYPVITITGPRQSGKTTLCKNLFVNKKYFNLEAPDIRNYAAEDPRSFLNDCKKGAIIDEIQRLPDLLSYIQAEVDEKKKPGQFIVTGSQNFQLLNSVSQSLAGRTALLTLLPFSLSEIKTDKKKSLDNILYKGLFPRIYDHDLNPTEAMSYYVNTYIEKDLRSLINVKDLMAFETFLKLCAGRTGQVLNFSSLGNDCGVSHNTIKEWISILEASYIIKLLRPYYKNYGKRLIKSAKLYFLDTGLAAFLLGIQNETQVESHPLKGALFETLIISELLKSKFNSNKSDNLYFFRDHKGNEIDVIFDQGMDVSILEIKSGQTINNDFFKNIKYFRNLNSNMKNSYLVYGGSESRTQFDVKITPWREVHLIRDM